MKKTISSRASKEEGSETRSKDRRVEVHPKPPAPSDIWGEDIARSAWKHAAVLNVLKGGYEVLESGCWEWKLGKSHGYGQMRVHSVFGSAPLYAHRVSYVLYHGGIPKGLSVCHRCDNPYCVNPNHLFLGTQQDNLADMVSKNRHAKGEKNGAAKFSDVVVEEVRKLVADGMRQYKVAEQFGISGAQVSRIVRGTRRSTADGVIRQHHGNIKAASK